MVRQFGFLLLLASVYLGLAGLHRAERAGADDRDTAAVTRTAVEGAALSVDVTNGGTIACQVTTRPMGALTILALTRDGKPVMPLPADVRVLDGLSGEHRGQFTLVKPGASVRITLRAVSQGEEGVFLPSVSWGPDGVPFAVLWPLEGAGRYAASVAYQAPSTVVTPADACTRLALPPAVVFDLKGGGRASWPILLVAGVSLAFLLLAVVFLARRRRRRRPGNPAPPAAVAAAILLCLAVGASFAGPLPSAHASVQAPDPDSKAPGARDVSNFWKVCLGRFLEQGGDPGGVVSRVLGSKRTVYLGPTDGESTTISRPGTDSIIILWNPLDTAELSSGKKQDPCATLFHELAHADAAMQGQDSDDPCGDTGISKAEAKATLKENQYRGHAGLPTREKYDEHRLPQTEGECDKPPKKPQPPSRGPAKRGRGVDGGRSTGDPHVFTFDRSAYDLMGVGEYVLATADQPGFAVQVRSQPIPGSRNVSVNTAVAMDVAGDRVTVSLSGPDLRLRANGREATATFDAALELGRGGIVEAVEINRHPGYVIEWPGGSAVQVLSVGPWALDITVEPPTALRGRLKGLLGNADGDPANDLVGRDGKAYGGPPISFEDLYRRYGEGWRVTAGESLFDYGPGESTETFTDRSFPDATTERAALPGLAAAEAACRRVGLTDPARIAECAYDLAVTGRPEFASAALAGEVSAASASGAASQSPGGATGSPGQVTDITFDREVSGTILAAGQVDTFGLTVPEGGVVVFVRGLQACDPTRRLTMQLSRPSGGVTDIAQACDGLGREELRDAGTWTITVSGEGSAVGPYRFIVARIGTDASGAAGAGRTLTGSLKVAGQLDRYTVEATQGQVIYVRGPGCQATSPAIQVLLKDPGGGGVNIGRTCEGFGRQVLGTPGVWTFEVSASGNGTGDYSFEVLSVRPDRVVAVAPGQRLSGTIEAVGVHDVFTFEAAAGQAVFVRALEACTDANRGVLSWLYDPAEGATDVARACDGLGRRDLRDPGTWKIVVEAGAGTGTYRMELLAVRPDAIRPITVGQTVQGAIEQTGARDRWTFEAKAGDRVSIRGLADCTPADLRWELLSPSGQAANLGRVCDTSASATPLGTSGQWTIRIAAPGDGTGSYELALQRE